MPIPIEQDVFECARGLFLLREDGTPPILLVDTEYEEYNARVFGSPGGELILINLRGECFAAFYPLTYDSDICTEDEWEFGCLLIEKVVNDPSVFDLKAVPAGFGIKIFASYHPYLVESLLWYPSDWYDVLDGAGRGQLVKIPKYSFMWKISEGCRKTIARILPLFPPSLFFEINEGQVKLFEADLILNTCRKIYASNNPFYGYIFSLRDKELLGHLLKVAEESGIDSATPLARAHVKGSLFKTVCGRFFRGGGGGEMANAADCRSAFRWFKSSPPLLKSFI